MSDQLIKILAKFDDPSICEVCINGTEGMFTYQTGGIHSQTASPFLDNREAEIWCQDFAFSQNTRLDPNQAFAGGKFEDKFRWHFLMRPIAINGPYLSFRKLRAGSFSAGSFGDPHGLWPEISSHFITGKPLLICGETSSGKTSLLATLIRECSAQERWICLEQTPELPALTRNWVHLCASVPDLDGYGGYELETLFAEALRLRPDRLLVGEIRRQEARTLIKALQIGMQSVCGTIHAGSSADLVARFEQLSGHENIKQEFCRQRMGAVFMNRAKVMDFPKISSFSIF